MIPKRKDDGNQHRELVKYLTRRLALAAIAGLFVFGLLELALSDLARSNAQNRTQGDVNRFRAALQQVLSRDVQLIRGMVGYVRAQPNLTVEEFRLIASDILEGAPDHLKNIALARDLVISHIYPEEGNETALGLDYRSQPQQWPAVERAIQEQRIIVAGPIDLVQGGVGLVARVPITLRAEDRSDRPLWGVVSSVLDFPALLDHTGYGSLSADYRIALVGRDGDPTSDEIIWGDPDIRSLDPVTLDVVIPTGSWRILAAPREGWPTFITYLPLLLPILVILLLIYAIWELSRFRLIEERINANKEVLAALQRAEEASAAKSTFLAVMSHELRTPLNAIIGFSELLENSPRDSRIWERAPEYVSDIRQSGRFLLSIIDDILDLSRIESGRRTATIEHADVVPLILEAAKRMRVEFETHGIALAVSAESEEMIARGDRRAIIQILNNLLTNALKYAGPSANVTIAAAWTDTDRIEIIVSDNGPGIPEEKLGEIMKPFVQLSSSYARTAGGVGLGLTICLSLARMMDGTFTIDSTVGVGTKVRLTVPASPNA